MRAALVVAAWGLVLLAGCSVDSSSLLNQTEGAQAAIAGVRLTGKVMGGQGPISGANVYLLAANTTGNAGPGIAATSNNRSSSLLTSGLVDSSGGPTNGYYYVTTDSNGMFTLTGNYSCALNQQVYLYALGGNPGLALGTNNSAAGLLEVLGNCPGGNSAFASADPNIVINEVTTIAAAYAFAGFATDATHVSSSGTALALTGIANAFANAGNIASIVNGSALTTTPAGNGTVPQSTINTLANTLAACVNTVGPGSSACTTLLADALSGGTTGTAPTDTATAAINMAHNPGTHIAALYALSIPTPPFAPALSAQPNDFTIGLQFAGGGMDDPQGIAIDGSGNAWVANCNVFGGGVGGSVTVLSSSGSILSGAAGYTGGGINCPVAIALDGSGNAWVANQTTSVLGSVTKLSSSGSFLSGANGYTGGGITSPFSIAIDGSGNAWAVNPNSVTKLSSSGVPISPSTGYTGGLSGPQAVAIDGSGNAWIPTGGNHVTKLSNSGSVLSGSNGYTGGGLNAAFYIAIDGSGDAWMSNFQGPIITKLSSSGASLSGTNGFTGGGLSSGWGIAIDGAGNAWVANYASPGGSVVEFSSSGAVLSGASGYTGGLVILPGPNSIAPFDVVIDGSGDAWVLIDSTNSVAELIGAATPVITPICAGLPATPTVNGTSNLGTRP